MALAAYMLWHLFWEPSTVTHQLMEQRQEDRERTKRLEEMLNRNHKQLMDKYGVEKPQDDQLQELERRMQDFEEGVVDRRPHRGTRLRSPGLRILRRRPPSRTRGCR